MQLLNKAPFLLIKTDINLGLVSIRIERTRPTPRVIYQNAHKHNLDLDSILEKVDIFAYKYTDSSYATRFSYKMHLY